MWAFAQAFDAAYLTVAKRQQAEAAEANKKSPAKGGDKALATKKSPSGNGSVTPLQELSQAVKKRPSGTNSGADLSKAEDAAEKRSCDSGSKLAGSTGDSLPMQGSAVAAKKIAGADGTVLPVVPNGIAEGTAPMASCREGAPGSGPVTVGSPPVADVLQGGTHGRKAENGRHAAGIPAQG